MGAPTVAASTTFTIRDKSGGADADGIFMNPFDTPCVCIIATAPNAATYRLVNPDSTDPVNIAFTAVAGCSIILPPRCGFYTAAGTAGAKIVYYKLGQNSNV